MQNRFWTERFPSIFYLNFISIKNIYSCMDKHLADKKRKPKLSGQNKSNENATSPNAKTAGKHLRGRPQCACI